MSDQTFRIHFAEDAPIGPRSNVPSLEELQALERDVSDRDDQIAGLRAQLKLAREQREEAIAALRSRIRGITVLPLFDAAAPAPPAEAPGDHD
jgi:hypothetical protein